MLNAVVEIMQNRANFALSEYMRRRCEMAYALANCAQLALNTMLASHQSVDAMNAAIRQWMDAQAAYDTFNEATPMPRIDTVEISRMRELNAQLADLPADDLEYNVKQSFWYSAFCPSAVRLSLLPRGLYRPLLNRFFSRDEADRMLPLLRRVHHVARWLRNVRFDCFHIVHRLDPRRPRAASNNERTLDLFSKIPLVEGLLQDLMAETVLQMRRTGNFPTIRWPTFEAIVVACARHYQWPFDQLDKRTLNPVPSMNPALRAILVREEAPRIVNQLQQTIVDAQYYRLLNEYAQDDFEAESERSRTDFGPLVQSLRQEYSQYLTGPRAEATAADRREHYKHVFMLMDVIQVLEDRPNFQLSQFTRRRRQLTQAVVDAFRVALIAALDPNSTDMAVTAAIRQLYAARITLDSDTPMPMFDEVEIGKFLEEHSQSRRIYI